MRFYLRVGVEEGGYDSDAQVTHSVVSIKEILEENLRVRVQRLVNTGISK